MSFDHVKKTSSEECLGAVNRHNELCNEIYFLKQDLKKAEEDFIFYFIKKEVEKECSCRHNRIVQLITHNYTRRFNVRDEIVSNGKLTGHHIYNFGDLLHDEDNQEKCIVVDETKCYVWVWYFNLATDDSVADKKRKNTQKYSILKRCFILEHGTHDEEN